MKRTWLRILLVCSLLTGTVACAFGGNRSVASLADSGMRSFTAPCDLRTAPLEEVNQEVQNYEKEGFRLISVHKMSRNAEQSYPPNTCSFIFAHP